MGDFGKPIYARGKKKKSSYDEGEEEVFKIMD